MSTSSMRNLGTAVTLALAAAAAQALPMTSVVGIGGEGFGGGVSFGDSFTAGQIRPPTSEVRNDEFYATWGPNPPFPGIPPFAAYPIRYSGAAQAAPVSGLLKARIEATQLAGALFRGGNASASIGGTVEILGDTPGAPVEFTLRLPFDGLLTGQSAASLTIEWRPAGQVAWNSQTTDAFPVNGGPTSIDLAPQVALQGLVGDRIDFRYSLAVSASTASSGYGLADFSSTARMIFELPEGISLRSTDGFLAEVPLTVIPEPQTLALWLAGLGVLLPLACRRARNGTASR